jgi:hypothetical protein
MWAWPSTSDGLSTLTKELLIRRVAELWLTLQREPKRRRPDFRP